MPEKGNIRTEVLTTKEEFGKLKEQWNGLLRQSDSNVVCMTWEWLWLWWNTYGTDKTSLSIILIYRADEIIGIAPFYRITKEWKKLFTYRRMLFIGSDEKSLVSEFQDIISTKKDKLLVVESVLETVIAEDLSDDLLLHKVDTSSESTLLLKECAAKESILYMKSREFESPYIKLPGTYKEYMMQLGSSTRSKIRRDQRRIAESNTVRYRRTSNAEELDTDFKEFVKLHTVRWKSRSQPGSFETGRFKGFLKSIAIEMLKNGDLDLYFCEVSGRPAAAVFNIRYNNKISFFQSGLNTEVAPGLSPGLLLHDNAIHEAIDAGIEEYDFLMMGSTDQYKKRLAKESRFLCDIYLARPGLMKALKRMEIKVKFFIDFLRQRDLGTATS